MGMVHLSFVLVDEFSSLSVIFIQEFVCLDFLSELASNAVQCVTKSSSFFFLLFISIGLSCKGYEMYFCPSFINFFFRFVVKVLILSKGFTVCV